MARNRIMQGIILCAALWSAGCAASAPKGRVIYQQGEAGKAELLVRLDHAKKGAPFDHPATVSPERLTSIFSSITVRWHTGLLSAIFGREPRRAFREEEATVLAAHLSQALAAATPQEVAVFYLNGPETGEQARITSGGIVVRAGQLIVTLANYNYVISWSDQASGKFPASATTARESPLSSYPESDYLLIPAAGQQLVGGDPSTMSKIFGKPSRSLTMALEPGPVAEPKRAEPEAIATPAPPAPPPPSALEEKLRTLKKLRDDGLITESDYEAKKQKLLDGF